MKKQNPKLIVYRVDGGDFLCPSCQDIDVSLAMDSGNSNTYYCAWCKITGSIDRLEIVNTDRVPKNYHLKSLQRRMNEAFRTDKSYSEVMS